MFRGFQVLQPSAINYIKNCRIPMRNLSNTLQLFKDNIENDEPIKFSTSKASTYKAKTSRMGNQQPRLWYEPYVIMVSLSVFMIYFTILREENDIDYELGRSLYSRIEGLEEFQLKQALDYNKLKGQDTSEITKRLKELEAEKKVSSD